MNLRDLHLENFRQFYGEQKLVFADGHGGRNVTVIHGYNGAGKTALLNAFVWCLYGKTTSDFEASDKLINERALAEASVGDVLTILVRLRFHARGKEWIVQRSQNVTKRGANDSEARDPELGLWHVVNGEIEAEGGDPRVHQRQIDQLLPPALYPFFFFNGERVEWLATAQGSDEVETGVKMLLDVEIFDRSVKHLRDVGRELSLDLKAFGDEDLRKAIEEEMRLDELIVEYTRKLQQCELNVAALEDEQSALERQREAIARVADLQVEINNLREQLMIARDVVNRVEARRRDLVSRDAYLAFAEPAFVGAETLVTEARQKGELPARIKPQFVTDLLERGECICTRALDPKKNPKEVQALERWRASTGLAAQEHAIASLGAAIKSLRHRRIEYFAAYDKAEAERSAAIAEKNSLSARISVLEEELGSPEFGTDVHRIAVRLKSLRDELVDEKASILQLKDNIRQTEELVKHAREHVKRLQQRSAKAELLQRQKSAVENVADAIEKIHHIVKDDVRTDLSKSIAEIWGDAAIKDFAATLTKDFRLALSKKVDGVEQPVYGASTGEKQVLALSFVASLVKKARDNLSAASSGALGILVGGEYPVVMDSPFGALEDDYRAKVAKWVPTLAHQVVVMVSKTQWRQEVESQMRGRIGAEYVLLLHSPKEASDRDIVINGSPHPYVVHSQDVTERTEIKGVT